MLEKIILFLSLFIISFDCLSFTFTTKPPTKYDSNTVKVYISTGSCGSNLSTSDLESWVESAAKDYWNKVTTSALKLEPSGMVSRDLTDIDDDAYSEIATYRPLQANSIIVGCNDLNTNFGVSDSTLGVGVIVDIGTKKVGMVLVNTNSDFSDTGQSIALIAHELGHALGLGHSSDPIALMYYAVGGKIQERLTMDDKDGITWLYPHEKKVPASCGSIAFISNSDNNGSNGGPMGPSLLLGFLLALLASVVSQYGYFSRNKKKQAKIRHFSQTN